jgi:hypothetical protein
MRTNNSRPTAIIISSRENNIPRQPAPTPTHRVRITDDRGGRKPGSAIRVRGLPLCFQVFLHDQSGCRWQVYSGMSRIEYRKVTSLVRPVQCQQGLLLFNLPGDKLHRGSPCSFTDSLGVVILVLPPVRPEKLLMPSQEGSPFHFLTLRRRLS